MHPVAKVQGTVPAARLSISIALCCWRAGQRHHADPRLAGIDDTLVMLTALRNWASPGSRRKAQTYTVHGGGLSGAPGRSVHGQCRHRDPSAEQRWQPWAAITLPHGVARCTSGLSAICRCLNAVGTRIAYTAWPASRLCISSAASCIASGSGARQVSSQFLTALLMAAPLMART